MKDERIRTFVVVTCSEGPVCNENSAIEVERLLKAPPANVIGDHEIFGLQMQGDVLIGVILGGTQRGQTELRTGNKTIFHGGISFRLNEKLAARYTGHVGIDALFDFTLEKLRKALHPAST